MSLPLIMVVDDEVDVANAITKTIKNTGRYDVVTAYSAKEALQNLAKHKRLLGLGNQKIRLVILDVKMPEMDGLQLLELIRNEYSIDIGVMLLTAFENEEMWEKATSGFIVSYLRKPFKREELLETIDRFFAGKEPKMVIETLQKHLDKQDEFEAQRNSSPAI